LNGGVKVNQCNSVNGSISQVPVCECNENDEEEDKGFCDIDTGLGCATDKLQVSQLTNNKEILEQIKAGNISLTDIKGIVQKSDGTFTDIKTLLSEIKNQGAITGGGGGGGGLVSTTPQKVELAGGIAKDFDALPTFEEKREALEELVTAKENQIVEIKNRVADTSVFDTLNMDGSCLSINFNGTYLSSLGNINVCETLIISYLQKIILFLAVLIAAVILLRKN
jgi:SepF-like predicted cell division protein (DUF552 family)